MNSRWLTVLIFAMITFVSSTSVLALDSDSDPDTDDVPAMYDNETDDEIEDPFGDLEDGENKIEKIFIKQEQKGTISSEDQILLNDIRKVKKITEELSQAEVQSSEEQYGDFYDLKNMLKDYNGSFRVRKKTDEKDIQKLNYLVDLFSPKSEITKKTDSTGTIQQQPIQEQQQEDDESDSGDDSNDFSELPENGKSKGFSELPETDDGTGNPDDGKTGGGSGDTSTVSEEQRPGFNKMLLVLPGGAGAAGIAALLMNRNQKQQLQQRNKLSKKEKQQSVLEVPAA